MLLSDLVESWGPEQADIDPAERRLTVRLFNYWNKIREDRAFPPRAIIRFDDVPGLYEFGFTMSVGEGESSLTLHYLGTALREHIDLGLDSNAIQTSDNKTLSQSLNRSFRRYVKVMERKEPVAFESEGFDSPGVQFAYRVVMLPFSEDNEQIDFILGAITYKEKLSETTLSPDSESNLARSLRECQELVSDWRAEETKSRAILYGTLERAYAFQFEALEDSKSYEALCVAAGINHQPRAPFTPLIKLIFGKEYDRTRISEYAACLSYAKRIGQEPGTLRDLIEATEGGIKGCVKAERVARRDERNQGDDKLSRSKKALRQLAPIAEIVDKNGYAEEFVLLLARRDLEGSDRLHVLCVLHEKPSVIEPAIKRAANAEARLSAKDE